MTRESKMTYKLLEFNSTNDNKNIISDLNYEKEKDTNKVISKNKHVSWYN